MRNIVNKKFKKGVLVGTSIATMLLALVGCGKAKTVNVNTSTDATTEATNTATDVTNNVDNNQDTNDTFVPGDLDIYSDASIENEVDAIYEANPEWYDENGMDKEEIRDLIYVVNGRYTNNDGELIIDEARAQEAFVNINKIMGNSGSPILQKMSNIDTLEYESKNITEVSDILERVEEENNWEITGYPTFVSYVDTDIAGGKLLEEKVEEFEALRDYEVKTINETHKYDRKKINEFVDKQEITDPNSNKDYMNSVDTNGQKYTLAVMGEASLAFAAAANPNQIYLEGYGYKGVNFCLGNISTLEYKYENEDKLKVYEDDQTGMYVIKISDDKYTTLSGNVCEIKENGDIVYQGTTKINPTNRERALENIIIEMTLNGTLDASTLDSAMKEIMSNSERTEYGFVYTGEEEVLKQKYGYDDKVVDYAFFKTSMANTKYQQIQCDEANNVFNDIEIKNNKAKKYTLSKNGYGPLTD